MTLVPWAGGKPLTWDVTAVWPLATSYLVAAASNAGLRQRLQLSAKLPSVQTLGPSSSSNQLQLNHWAHESARQFLVDLGHRITGRSGDDREGSLFISTHFCFVAPFYFSFVAR